MEQLNLFDLYNMTNNETFKIRNHIRLIELFG